MDKKLTRMILETGKTNDEYEKLWEEIGVRSTLAILYEKGDIFCFDTRLLGNDVIIVLLESGEIIKINFDTFCSDQWKENIFTNRNIKTSLDRYNDAWYRKTWREIGKHFVISSLILSAGLIPAVALAVLEPDTTTTLITLSLLFIGYLKAIMDKRKGVRTMKYCYKTAEVFRDMYENNENIS